MSTPIGLGTFCHVFNKYGLLEKLFYWIDTGEPPNMSVCKHLVTTSVSGREREHGEQCVFYFQVPVCLSRFALVQGNVYGGN